jgi:hypothetical protein
LGFLVLASLASLATVLLSRGLGVGLALVVGLDFAAGNATGFATGLAAALGAAFTGVLTKTFVTALVSTLGAVAVDLAVLGLSVTMDFLLLTVYTVYIQ